MRKAKKGFVLLLILVLCLQLRYVCVATENVQAEEIDNSTVYHTEDGWLYICEDLETDSPHATIVGFDYDIGGTTDLTIPQKVVNLKNNTDIYVTSIMKAAFSEDKKITSVSIPQSVVDIGFMAFSKCINLKSVKVLDGAPVSDSKGVLGNGAFTDCTSLESVELPNGIGSIESQSFLNCINLKSITIPLDTTKIKEQAFYNCKSLECINIPGGVKTIDDYAFYGCSSLNTVLLLNNDLTKIGDYAFAGCSSLVGIKIPESVTSIGSHAFEKCTSLESIVIPESVTELGTLTEEVFKDCKKLTIYTTSGSKAEEMGKAWGIKVVLMDKEENDTAETTFDSVIKMTYYAKCTEKTSLQWRYFHVENPKKGKKITKLKSSNTKVVSAKTTAYEDEIKLLAKKAGTAKITFDYAGKTYTAKVIVRAYENPYKTFKIGNKDFTKYYNRSNHYNLNKQKKNYKGKITISLKDGWKLVQIKNYNTKVKNKGDVKLNRKDYTWGICVTVQNKKTKEKQEFSLSYTDLPEASKNFYD